MVGIPDQDYASALKNVDFCEEIHQACNQDRRLSYFIAPLAPFLDPASPAFENPDLYGYKNSVTHLKITVRPLKPLLGNIC